MLKTNNEIQCITGTGKLSNLKQRLKIEPSSRKTIYTNICTLDTTLNILHCTGFLQSLENHSLCDHKERCITCIVRSALLKANFSKTNKPYVECPEILHNLNILFGSEHCSFCDKLFIESTKKEEHSNCQYSIKTVLSIILKKTGLLSTFETKFKCSECKEDLIVTPEGFLTLTEKGDSLYKSFIDTSSKVLEEHRKICSTSSKYYYERLPSDLIFFMRPGTCNYISENIDLNGNIYKYGGQICF